jgi:hypothetical protein
MGELSQIEVRPAPTHARCLARRCRRGTAAVEFAVVAPLIFLFFFGSIEFGRMLMIMHSLESASREGCRVAVTWKATRQDVADIVSERLATFGIRDYELTVEPQPLSRAAQWSPVSVQIEVAYHDLAWLPVPKYLEGITLKGSCTLPQESDRSEQ